MDDALDDLVRSSANFGYLVEHEPVLAYDGASAESYIYTDPDAAMFTTPRTYTYDAAGRVVAVGAPGDQRDTYTYSDRDLLLSSSGPGGAATYSYDADGRLTQRTDAAGTATFAYRPDGSLLSAADPLTGITTGYAYNEAGQLTRETYGNGGSREYRHDPLGQITSDTVRTADGTTLHQIGYGYDAAGRLTTKTTGGLTNTYQHDQAGRLTEWSNGSKSTVYGWDAAGNRVRAGDRTATYDERNRLLTDGTDHYTYSPRGTLDSIVTATGPREQRFDAFDRLTRDGAIGYQYDTLDRVATRGQTTLTYAGPSNDLVTDGTATYNRLPSGRVTSSAAGGSVRRLVADRHGDIVTATDGAASTTPGTTTYDPFGNVVNTTGASGRLGYQGAWTDPDTGQVNMHARWYDPGTGAFSSRDNIDLPTIPSGHANRYAYGAGTPLDAIDPTGHEVTWLQQVWSFIKQVAPFVPLIFGAVATAPWWVLVLGGVAIALILYGGISLYLQSQQATNNPSVTTIPHNPGPDGESVRVRPGRPGTDTKTNDNDQTDTGTDPGPDPSNWPGINPDGYPLDGPCDEGYCTLQLPLIRIKQNPNTGPNPVPAPDYVPAKMWTPPAGGRWRQGDPVADSTSAGDMLKLLNRQTVTYAPTTAAPRASTQPQPPPNSSGANGPTTADFDRFLEVLPKRPKDATGKETGKTTGIALWAEGNGRLTLSMRFQSGWQNPLDQHLKDVTQDWLEKTHQLFKSSTAGDVEQKVATFMRLRGVESADLVINNSDGPCRTSGASGDTGCFWRLDYVLAPGHLLTVHWKDELGMWWHIPFVGP